MQVLVGGMPANARVLDRGVAVAAVDAVAGDVALVAELDRLLARDARLGHPRRPIDLVDRPSRPATTNTAPKILTREIVFALRWKICDIDRATAVSSELTVFLHGSAHADFVKRVAI